MARSASQKYLDLVGAVGRLAVDAVEWQDLNRTHLVFDIAESVRALLSRHQLDEIIPIDDLLECLGPIISVKNKHVKDWQLSQSRLNDLLEGYPDIFDADDYEIDDTSDQFMGNGGHNHYDGKGNYKDRGRYSG